MSRLLELADTILGWLERTPWGTRMIALAAGLTVFVWGRLTTGLPSVGLFALGLNVLLVVLVIQELGIPKLRRHLSPPLRVEIPISAKGRDMETGEASVQCGVHILNISRVNRVSVDFAIRVELHDPTLKYRSFGNMSVRNQGVETDLGPQEHTEGHLEARWRQPQFNLLEQANSCYLDIRDRISLRRMSVLISGPTPPMSRKEQSEQQPSS